MLTTQFIKGLTNQTVKTNLIMTDDLKLAQAVTKAERYDLTVQTQRLENSLRKPGVASCTCTEDTTPQITQADLEQGLAEVQAVGQPPRTIICYGCKQTGHIIKDCPHKSASQQQSSQRSRTPEGAKSNSSQHSKGGYPPRNQSSGHYGNVMVDDDFCMPFPVHYPYFVPPWERQSRRDSYYGGGRGYPSGGHKGGSQNRYRSGSGPRSGSRASTDRYRSQSGGRSVPRGVKCHACSGYGHYANECPTQKRDDRYRSSSRTRGNCHNCGKPGHFAAECSSKVVPVSSSKERKGKSVKKSPKDKAHTQEKHSV